MSITSGELTTEERRKALADLAGIVWADRRHGRPVYSDSVLQQMLPPLCYPSLHPAVVVELFGRLIEEQAEVTRFDATDREITIAEDNAEHYVSLLVHGAAEAKAS